MASRFDPSAFIEAEEQALATLAPVASELDREVATPKTTKIGHFSAATRATLAPIATIARGHARNTPWNDAVTTFITIQQPDFAPANHWVELVHETEAIEESWGEIAHQAGWTSLHLYGCPAEPLARWYGQSGLVHAVVTLPTPVRIVSLDRQAAVLRSFRGDDMRFYPNLRPGAVHLWEAYRPTSGP